MKKSVKAKKLVLDKATLRDNLDNQYLRAVSRGALLTVIASFMAAGCASSSEPGSAADGTEELDTDDTVAGEGSSPASPGTVYSHGDPFLVNTTALVDVAASTQGDLNPVKATVAQQNITSLSYTTYLGFGGDDYGQSIAIHGSGNAYICGLTYSFGSAANVFVTKLSPSGAQLYYVYFPGTDCTGLAVDSAGNAYVATSKVLTKINPTGTGIFYSSTIGWGGISAVQVDAGGNAYLTGLSTSGDVAVGKLNPAGTAFIYAVTFGGTRGDGGLDIAIDTAGSAYIVGYTASNNFPVVNAFQSYLRGEMDAFVTKLNATGTGIVFSTYLGGDAFDAGLGIAVDSNNNAYVTGNTDSASFPVSIGSAQSTYRGLTDAFVTKFSPTGTRLYSTYIGGGQQESGYSIAVTPAGVAYVVGYTYSTDFPTTASAFQPLAPGGIPNTDNAYVVQLNTTGSAFAYSTYLGGNDHDSSSSIAVNSSGRVYAMGSTRSTNFPTTVYAHGGFYDAFVTTFNGP